MANFPTGTFTTPNRVVLIGDGGRQDERVASVITYPGMLVMDDGSGGYKPHNVAGGIAEFVVALEQGLRGIGGSTEPKGVWDYYDVNDNVQVWVAGVGNELQVLLANGANATENALLQSDGAGHFSVAPSNNAAGNLYETTAASAALTTTSTQTVFSTGSYSIPANFLQVGDLLHVRAEGTVTAHNASDTLTVQLYLGGLTGTSIVSTGAVNNAVGDNFILDAYIEFRTIGNAAAGTFIANGTFVDGVPSTATVRSFLLASTAVDTTVAEQLAVAGTWSSASAGNSARLDYMTVDLIRQAGPITPLAVVLSAVNNTSGTGTTYPYSPAALVTCRVLR